MWRFESVHGFTSVGNLYQKMHFAGSNPATGQKTPKCIYKISKKCRVEKTGEISRNLPFSRFSSLGSKLTCHHVSIRRFRCVRSCQPIQMHPKGRLPPWQEPDLQITAVFRDCKIVRVNGNYVSNLPI